MRAALAHFRPSASTSLFAHFRPSAFYISVCTLQTVFIPVCTFQTFCLLHPCLHTSDRLHSCMHISDLLPSTSLFAHFRPPSFLYAHFRPSAFYIPVCTLQISILHFCIYMYTSDLLHSCMHISDLLHSTSLFAHFRSRSFISVFTFRTFFVPICTHRLSGLSHYCMTVSDILDLCTSVHISDLLPSTSRPDIAVMADWA